MTNLASGSVLNSLLIYTTAGHCKILSDHMDNIHLATELFVKDVNDLYDGLICLAHYPDHGRLCIAFQPVQLSTWNTGEVQLIT